MVRVIIDKGEEFELEDTPALKIRDSLLSESLGKLIRLVFISTKIKKILNILKS